MKQEHIVAPGWIEALGVIAERALQRKEYSLICFVNSGARVLQNRILRQYGDLCI